MLIDRTLRPTKYRYKEIQRTGERNPLTYIYRLETFDHQKQYVPIIDDTRLIYLLSSGIENFSESVFLGIEDINLAIKGLLAYSFYNYSRTPLGNLIKLINSYEEQI